MKDWNPTYQFRSVSLTNSFTNNVVEIVIDLESVVHHLSASAVFDTFAGTQGVVAAGFNLADSGNISNVDPDLANNAIVSFSSGVDLANPLHVQYQQFVPLDHMIVPAGSRFQVVFLPSGGLVTFHSHWSIAINPLSEWKRWHDAQPLHRLPLR